jgi:hypothetical protein
MADVAHVPHEMVDPNASVARFTARGLAAMAVMNIPEDTVVHKKHVIIKYAPIFFSVPFSGSDPHARHNALANGRNKPPARAATEGIAGANNASANTREYVSPNVVFPNRDTML